MYAVVYLIESKTQIVEPKNFIRGLCQQKLDNYGKNRNISFVVYYSKQICENGLVGNESVLPNFELQISTQFPPQHDETCFKAQIKYFFGMHPIRNISSEFSFEKRKWCLLFTL